MIVRHEQDGLWIELRETIAVHHENVFACFTSPSELTRWFPVAAQVDLRQGGTVVFGWDADFEKKSTVAILDYDAGGRVVWDWFASVHDLHAPVYWTVEPDVEEGSIVTMRQGPFAGDEESMLAMTEEAASWQWRLCNLRGVLEAKHDMRRVKPL